MKFLYLSEKDMIAAGVEDTAKCLDVMIEVFQLIGQGDYIMGGPNGNSHGVKIYFPKETEHEGMPVYGPDRRFMALISYLGGRFRMCGNKWYGSNLANKEKGLPRSILTVMINDPDTGAPVALMSANILSAMRTGAIPGVGARYMAKPGAKTAAEVGAGTIGRQSIFSILEGCKTIEEVKVYDLYPDAALNLCRELAERYGVKAVPVNSVEEAVKESDIINIATAGAVAPHIEDQWLADGALLSMPAGAEISKALMTENPLVVDEWKMYEAYEKELEDMPGSYSDNLSGICGSMIDYVKDGSLKREEIISMGEIVAGKRSPRRSEKDKIIFIQDGLPVEDVAWACTVYENAKKMGIGVELSLFGE